MGQVQPFVAIVLGEGPQRDAEQLARAVGAIAILRPGQPHPVPLHAPDAVIDLAAQEHSSGSDEAVIDLAPAGDRAGAEQDDVIDLNVPDHSEQPSPARMPGTAVVIDPEQVLDVPGLVVAVHDVLDRLTQIQSPCVAGVRAEDDTATLLAGPLDLLSAVAGQQVNDDEAPLGVRPLLEALIKQGHPVSIVPI